MFRWFDYGSEALLLLGPVAILHGVAVGAASLDSGQLEVRQRLRLADGVIFLAPVVILVDLVVFAGAWFFVAALST